MHEDQPERVSDQMAPGASELQPGLHADAEDKRPIPFTRIRQAKNMGRKAQNIEPRHDSVSGTPTHAARRAAHTKMRTASQKTEVSAVFEIHLDELNLPFVPEFRFCPKRKWRADYVVCKVGQPCLLVEIDGGVWVQGRHNRGAGFIADMEKQNHMALGGFFLMRFTPQQVLDGTAKQMVRKFYGL